MEEKVFFNWLGLGITAIVVVIFVIDFWVMLGMFAFIAAFFLLKPTGR